MHKIQQFTCIYGTSHSWGKQSSEDNKIKKNQRRYILFLSPSKIP